MTTTLKQRIHDALEACKAIQALVPHPIVLPPNQPALRSQTTVGEVGS